MKKAPKGAAPAALLKESARLTPHQGDLDALWKAVWDKPRDEGRRSVLADALQSAGDPRGEFIALQLAMESGTAEASAEKRANALLKQHLDTWAGGLPGVVPSSREFRRGFLSALRLKPGEHLAKGLDRLEWRTVERLVIDSYPSSAGQHLGALLQRMPALCALIFNRQLSDFAVKQLGAVFKTVELIAAPDYLPRERPSAFPSLRFICLSADPVKALESAKRAGLRGVMLRSATDLKRALAAFEKRTVQELRIAPGMFSDHVARGWMIRVTKEKPDQADLFHSGRYAKGSFTEWAKLCGTQDRLKLRIHCPSSLKKTLEEEPHGKAELSWSHASFDPFAIS